MRAAAVDLGKVRVGLAVSDELGLFAHPRPHLDGRDPARVVDALCLLQASEGIEIFLVGLPRGLTGGEGAPARRARRFAELLRSRTRAQVELVDERLSTREARSRLREQGLQEREMKDRVDSAAAAILLQSWLEAQQRRRS